MIGEWQVVLLPRATGPLPWALAACLVLGACAAPANRAAGASDTVPAVTDADREQRVRLLQQADALYLSGRLKEAQSAFEQLTRTYPRNAEIWFRYGNTLMRQGSYDDAAMALQNAVSLDPGYGRASLNLALARLGQAQAALDLARARLASNSPEGQQAAALQRQIQTLLGTPGGEAAPR
jgi:tetratricopeptide (TPR) repeat protein